MKEELLIAIVFLAGCKTKEGRLEGLGSPSVSRQARPATGAGSSTGVEPSLSHDESVPAIGTALAQGAQQLVSVVRDDALLARNDWHETVELRENGESPGRLILRRSNDGRDLVIQREHEFGEFMWRAPRRLETGPTGAYLQFVDGITEPGGNPKSPTSILLGNNKYYEQPVEAWVFLEDGTSAIRPKTGQEFRVLNVGGKKPNQLQWSVFVQHCPKGSGPCVLVGSPAKVCASAMKAQEGLEDGALLFDPVECP